MLVTTTVLAAALSACAQDDLEHGAFKSFPSYSSGDVVAGELQVLVADGEDGTSWLVHQVVDFDGVPIELTFDTDAPTPEDVAPKSLVHVVGDYDGDHFEVDELTVVSPPPSPIIDPTPFAPRKIAVLVIDWGSGPDMSVDEVRERMFQADYSTRNYYAEVSYGSESLEGDVFGPYTLPYNGCNSDSIAYNARQEFIADGHNPEEYEQFMYYFPSAGCGWSGLAMLGQPQDEERDSWYNGSFGCVVRNQELAHNYGLMHTHWYYCNGGAFSGSCSYEEYGSPFDPMGYGCGHMAMPDKEWMDWVEGCNIVDANSDGLFAVVPTSLPCNGTQALRVPTMDGRDYYIEYRNNSGFDGEEGISGVLVTVSGPGDWWGPEAYIIDLGQGGFLATGDSWTDPGGAVTFTVVEQDETRALIDVVFQNGGSGDPTCMDGSTPEQQAGVWGAMECEGGPFNPDATPPDVTITTPDDGQTFGLGESFPLRVDATDDTNVAQVAIYLDGALADVRTEEPWEWQINDLPVGMHEFVAKASDGVFEGVSPSITVEVTQSGGDDDDDDDDDDDSSADDGGEGGADGADDGGPGDDGGDGGDEAGADGEGGFDPEEDSLPPGFGQNGLEGCACRARRGAPGQGWLGLVGLALLGSLGRRRRRAGRAA